MVANLFLDTDIILDVLLKREVFYKESYAIFNLCEIEKVKLYTSSSIIINVQYIGAKISNNKKTASAIKYMVENFIEIVNPNRDAIVKAYNSTFKDYEDAIQYFTAKEASLIDFFITRNIKDYKNAIKTLPAYTPTQFLKLYAI